MNQTMIQIYTNDYSAHFIIAEARCHAPIVLPQRRRSASGACFQAPGGGRFVVKKWWNTVGTGWKMVGNDETWSELLKHVETCWNMLTSFWSFSQIELPMISSLDRADWPAFTTQQVIRCREGLRIPGWSVGYRWMSYLLGEKTTI